MSAPFCVIEVNISTKLSTFQDQGKIFCVEFLSTSMSNINNLVGWSSDKVSRENVAFPDHDSNARYIRGWKGTLNVH